MQSSDPVVHTSDDVFVDAPPRDVQDAILHVHEDPSWWPGLRAFGGYAWLDLDAPTGRGSERVRFKARIEDAREWEGFRWVFESGELQGSAEIWLETYRGGTIVHYFTAVLGTERQLSSSLRRHRWAIRAGLNGLKDRLDGSAPRMRPPTGSTGR